jgi:branched-chain amino acid transport system ATP-binding protein
MLLSVNDVRVHYGKVPVLRGVSLELEKGDIVALVGANGAGKTTLLKTISGLKSPTSGEIWFTGHRIDRARPAEIVRRGIGHIPEGRKVFSDMTVLENLMMGAYSRHDREGIKRDLLAVYQYFPILMKKRGQRAGSLSGGEQQMLAIGRALMCRPQLLLMDEPSLGLSPILVARIAEIITAINKQGVGIILVEQNASLALKVATSAYVMVRGEITLQGRSDELLNNEEVKKAFLGG